MVEWVLLSVLSCYNAVNYFVGRDKARGRRSALLLYREWWECLLADDLQLAD